MFCKFLPDEVDTQTVVVNKLTVDPRVNLIHQQNPLKLLFCLFCGYASRTIVWALYVFTIFADPGYTRSSIVRH